ncbi:hypothetical protein ACH3VR_12840 [Microbacterium sp. B2969]|uniref:Uncharacterized protein n=1 Tax=Microbacterium alkaliflavum TaxID=3248839 RepID=A0ABW7Q970_9MICO
MSDLHVGRMSAAVVDWPDPAQVPEMLRHVIDGRLEDAMREHPLPDGEWCVRRLDVALDLDPERPLSALEAGWADRIVTSLRQSLRDGSTDVIRYLRPEDAVDDMLTGLVSLRVDHSWAWAQVRLLMPDDPPPDGDPRALMLIVLERLRQGGVAALARLVATAGVARVHRLIGSEGWQRVAARAALEGGAAWTPEPVGRARPARAGDETTRGAHPDPRGVTGSGEPGRTTGRAARAVGSGTPSARDDIPSPALAPSGTQRVAALAAASALADAFRRSGLRVDDATLQAWALLTLAHDDVVLLRRPSVELRDLVAALAERLRPESSAGLSIEAPAPSRAPAARAAARPPADVGTRRADHPRQAAASASPEGDARPDSDDPEAPAGAGSRTSWGGLLFLLNTAARAGVPESLDEPPFRARPSGWVLHQLGRRLAPAAVDDPALLAFAGLPEPPADEPDAIERRALAARAARWTAQTATELRASGSVDGPDDLLVQSVVRRDATIEREPGWVEMSLRLGDVDLDVRRAGLDIDPGWVPWLGCVVRFRYE